MTDHRSSTGIYHLAVGNVSSQGMFCERRDYKKFMEILRLYKGVHGIRLLGYSLTPLVVHLIIHDRNGQHQAFLKELKETYRVFYSHKYAEERVFHQQDKIRCVETYEGFVNLYRHIHKQGINSLKRFREPGGNADKLLDADYVLGALGSRRKQAMNELLKVSEEPAPDYYQIQMKDMEFFREEKKSIRIRRAERFLNRFLERNGLSFDELMDDAHFNKRMELVKAYREQTDLSFRDIGKALELSHTTVIRIWRLAHERDLRSRLA